MGNTQKGKVLFVISSYLGHTTAYVRGLIFKEALKERGWVVTFVNISTSTFNEELDKMRKSEDEILEMAKDYDIVYLLKVNSYRLLKNIKKQTKAKVIFELTDALWKPNFRKDWFHLEEILKESDALFSENEYICSYGRRFSDRVISIPACTQTEKFNEERKNLQTRTDNQIIIGWIGRPSTIGGVLSLVKPLERLSARHPNLKLRIVGYDPEKLRKPLKNIPYSAQLVYDEQQMIREALSMDIGIFPAPSGLEDYQIRGALKGMIYMSAGIPAVCLNAGDPAKIIKDGLNGMLINSFDEWEKKIEKLILEPQLRKQIGQRAYETIKKEHSLEFVTGELEKAFLHVLKLERVPEPKATLAAALKRIPGKLSVITVIAGELIKKSFKKILLRNN